MRACVCVCRQFRSPKIVSPRRHVAPGSVERKLIFCSHPSTHTHARARTHARRDGDARDARKKAALLDKSAKPKSKKGCVGCLGKRKVSLTSGEGLAPRFRRCPKNFDRLVIHTSGEEEKGRGRRNKKTTRRTDEKNVSQKERSKMVCRSACMIR